MTDTHALPADYTAALVLASGEIFYGYGIGKEGVTYGEVCFNTGLTGYQEVLTDPSYAGQIITFTFPHIGNVGCNTEDNESRGVFAKGLIIREAITDPSNFRSESHLDAWLKQHETTGVCGIDTRALTRKTRLKGPQNVAIIFSGQHSEFGVQLEEAQRKLKDMVSLAGVELAQSVSTPSLYEWKQTRWELGKGFGELEHVHHHVVAIDYGEKLNILRCLASAGCKVTVVPATASAEDILDMKPDGVFLSNGPGDPAATAHYAGGVISKLVDANIPIFGICLGHQLLALAVGAKTEKMHQGHRGANHPVQRLDDGAVEITSQNHGFVVSHGSLPDHTEVTHLSLFDGTIEGFRLKDKPVFAVQYHPESSPGPHDSRYLFERFVEMMRVQSSGARVQ